MNINFDEFPTYPYMCIEPKNKKQRSMLDAYRKTLKISEHKEDFVLKCLLSFDWNRQIIICEIEKIESSKGLDMVDFRVMVSAPSGTVDYCVSNPLRANGWSLHSEPERCWYVYHNLLRYCK